MRDNSCVPRQVIHTCYTHLLYMPVAYTSSVDGNGTFKEGHMGYIGESLTKLLPDTNSNEYMI